jgi:UDPglucose--hexose-1-phosphate uridylyltransferase
MTDAGELRFDPLTHEWVNIVGHRQDRPNLPDDGCPFCVGGLEAPEPYVVRWFENRWPAYATGAEVILFSPQHGESLATLPHAQVRRVIDLWAERTQALNARPDVEYVLVFENRGREVGATIDHPHGQIYAYPFVPPIPAREGEIARAHGCAICAEVQQERASGTRVVATAGDWTAWVPYASKYAYGVHMAPAAHIGSLPALDDTSRDDLATLLIDVLGR